MTAFASLDLYKNVLAAGLHVSSTANMTNVTFATDALRPGV